MKEKDTKVIVIEIILTVVTVGQIVFSFILYNRQGYSAVRNLGWIVLWISAVFGWLPILTFKKWGKVPKGKSFVHTTELVDRGIYAIVRHPQYLAGMLLALSLYLIAQHWLVAILGAISIVIYYVSAFEEEKTAIEKFGEDYKRYKKSIPRFNFVLGIVRLLHKK